MIEKVALISILTSLSTEAFKKIFNDTKITCIPSVLASVLSALITLGVQFYLYCGTAPLLTTQVGCETLALMFLSFLSATLGYDKVKEVFFQIKE